MKSVCDCIRTNIDLKRNIWPYIVTLSEDLNVLYLYYVFVITYGNFVQSFCQWLVDTYTSRSFSATNKKTIRRKLNEIDRLESKAAENNGLVDQSAAEGRKWDEWAVVSGQRTVGNVASLGVDRLGSAIKQNLRLQGNAIYLAWTMTSWQGLYFTEEILLCLVLSLAWTIDA